VGVLKKKLWLTVLGFDGSAHTGLEAKRFSTCKHEAHMVSKVFKLPVRVKAKLKKAKLKKQKLKLSFQPK
jgi:hypothetical protein